MLLPEPRKEGLVDKVLGIVDLHFEFFEDDTLFLFDILRLKQWVQDQIRKDIKSEIQMIVNYLRVVTDKLLRCISVQISASRIDDLGDVFCCPVRRSLKQHVLDK